MCTYKASGWCDHNFMVFNQNFNLFNQPQSFAQSQIWLIYIFKSSNHNVASWQTWPQLHESWYKKCIKQTKTKTFPCCVRTYRTAVETDALID